MVNKLKLKRGSSSNLSKASLEQGELLITTYTNKLYSKKGEINPRKDEKETK